MGPFLLSRLQDLPYVVRGWLESGRSAVLSMPSAVIPSERSYLLNPAHLDFAQITMGESEALDTDFRLMRPLSGGDNTDAASMPVPARKATAQQKSSRH